MSKATKTKRVSLSKRVIEAMKPPASGRRYVYDQKQPGLAICITSTGTRTWYRYGRLNGRPERIKIGRFPDVTVEKARDRAREIAGDSARGIDPRRKKTDGTTLTDLFDHWITHAKREKKTWQDDQRIWNKYFKRLHKRPLSAIATRDVAEWHRKVHDKHGPYMANRCRALLSAMINKAHEIGHEGPNPCQHVKRFREYSRERFLLPDEMWPFFAALKAEPPIWRDFWTMCIFTGARKSNVAGMKWDNLDLGQGLWYVTGAEMKAKAPVVIVLPPPCVEILKVRHAERNGSPYVFPSERGDGHIIDGKKSWARVMKASGIDNLRPHDLRRTMGSWQALQGASLTVIGQSLGHRDVKSTAVYARLLVDPVRASVNGAVAAMLEAGETDKGKGQKRIAKSKGAK